jgi:hypothetical protein
LIQDASRGSRGLLQSFDLEPKPVWHVEHMTGTFAIMQLPKMASRAGMLVDTSSLKLSRIHYLSTPTKVFQDTSTLFFGAPCAKDVVLYFIPPPLIFNPSCIWTKSYDSVRPERRPSSYTGHFVLHLIPRVISVSALAAG